MGNLQRQFNRSTPELISDYELNFIYSDDYVKDIINVCFDKEIKEKKYNVINMDILLLLNASKGYSGKIVYVFFDNYKIDDKVNDMLKKIGSNNLSVKELNKVGNTVQLDSISIHFISIFENHLKIAPGEILSNFVSTPEERKIFDDFYETLKSVSENKINKKENCMFHVFTSLFNQSFVPLIFNNEIKEKIRENFNQKEIL